MENERQQAVHEILRSSHLSKKSMVKTTDKLADMTNDQLYDKIKIEKLDKVKRLEDLMARERVRPSLLAVAGPSILSIVTASCKVVLGEERAKLAVSGLEKGMQSEHDEQLRLLNDRNLKEPELRRLLIEMRDHGFDTMKG